jgi:hypothetical protein
MSGDALLVLPHERRDGFWANIRGHVLDLADPSSVHESAPTPDDLYIASVASELAWSSRAFLRANGVRDDVSVAAEWGEGAEISVTVTVPMNAAPVSSALAAALEQSLAARSLAVPAVHISLDGGNP